MLIAVDATPIREKPSGIGFYTLSLIRALAQLQSQANFTLTIAYQPSVKNWLKGNFSPPLNLSNNFSLKSLPLPVTISNLLTKFPNPIIPYCERYLDNPDILHGTDHYVYPVRNSLKIMTIHDVTFMKYPKYTNSIVKTYTQRVKSCLKWTDAIITFAENTKQEISEYLNVSQDRIFITPQASRYYPDYLIQTDTNQLANTVNYPWEQPYILFVSTLEPRKNLVNLIKAFNLLKQEAKIPHNLVLIGQPGWHYQNIFDEINKSPWQQDIYVLGYLSDDLVALFYQEADVFIYPSFYEGFGLPVLEAMTLGAPVVTSNTSSLPEVAGDAAILINPQNVEEIAAGIFRVISDRQLRDQLIQLGKERAKLFSWEKTAQATIYIYRSLLS